MLSGAGVLNLPPGRPDAKRLACYMALFRELASNHAFGPLQQIMMSIISEISCCIYTDTVCAVNVPQIIKFCPSEATMIHKVPFFMEIGLLRDEIWKMKQTTTENQELCQKAQEEQKGLQQKMLSSKVGGLHHLWNWWLTTKERTKHTISSSCSAMHTRQ